MVGKSVDVMTSTKTGYTIKKVGENMFDKLREFDDDIPDGVYAIPPDPNKPKVKVRLLDAYCKKVGKMPSELSKEEMENFLEYPQK